MLRDHTQPFTKYSLEECKIAILMERLSMVTIGNCFLPHLIFNSSTFSRWVRARWWRQWAKNQVPTNRNLRNRWCQIVRRTICGCYTSFCPFDRKKPACFISIIFAIKLETETWEQLSLNLRNSFIFLESQPVVVFNKDKATSLITGRKKHDKQYCSW